MKDLISVAKHIQTEAEKKLPGIEAHRNMLPEGRSMPDDYLTTISNYKQSAVFALLFEEARELFLLLTQRHQYEGMHSGQISFPGGKQDATDENLLATAYRETYEELGISSAQIQFITTLSPLYIPVSNFLVQPYIGYLASLPALLIDKREVESIIKFPLLQLNNPEIVKRTRLEASSGFLLTVPAYHFENKIVWGATAMILNEIATLIKPLSV